MNSFRYAHSEGHTDLCYTDDSKFIITCGSEGDVRIWNGIDDADQKDVCVGEVAWAISQKGKSMYVGTDTNVIQAYTFPELETDGIITRFTAPVTQIDISPNGQQLVAGSCDMEIHVVEISTMESKKLLGHRAPVLSVAFDPKMEYIASSSCDGTVRIWQLSTRDVIKQWDCVEKSNSFEASPSLCRIDFSKNGDFLGIPQKSQVKIYDRTTWNQVQSFSIDSTQLFSVVKFSPCATMIVGGTTNGNLYVWHIATEKLFKQTSDCSEHAVTAISWKRDSTSFAYCNIAGQLSELDLSESPPKNKICSKEDPAEVPLGEPDFDDDDDDENVISLEKIKAESSFYGNDIQIDSISQVDENEKEILNEFEGIERLPQIPLSELQQPFQPSSTPSHLLQRFMVWNNVGIVRQFDTEDSNEIDVEFHDTSVHHSFRINNVLSHTMAALSSKALILGSPKTSDSSSKIVCVLMKAWDGQKEWDVSLGNDNVLAVTAGHDWVAAATDSSILRLFTIDGTQTDIFAVPGPVVCIAASKNEVAVVFHTGVGVNGEQFLSFCRLRVNKKCKLFSLHSMNPLPLSPKSTLRWIGYTDEGSFSTIDSQGVLRVMFSKVWRPVCELDSHCKSDYDHYFVVGISESKHNIRCILCKGAYYPPVLPKPIVTEINWQIPLCEFDSEKGSLEEGLLRSLITLPNVKMDPDGDEQEKTKIEKSISVTVMKLFALACRSGLEGRAISLCESMPSVDVVKLAAKYAAKLGRHQLAERISVIVMNRSVPSPTFEREEEEEEEIVEQKESPQKQSSKEKQTFSQDIFDDSQAAVRDNLILKMRKKKEALSPKPTKIAKRHENPFKKNKILEETSDNQNEAGSSDVKLNFMDWYAKNRTKLQEEFPLLRESELALAGMKLYKQQNSSKPPVNDSQEEIIQSTPSDENESKKRKLQQPDDSEENHLPKKVSTSSKLKFFSFNKK